VSLGKALNGIASTFESLRLVVTGGSLTRRPKKVTSLSPGRGALTDKLVLKPKKLFSIFLTIELIIP